MSLTIEWKAICCTIFVLTCFSIDRITSFCLRQISPLIFPNCIIAWSPSHSQGPYLALRFSLGSFQGGADCQAALFEQTAVGILNQIQGKFTILLGDKRGMSDAIHWHFLMVSRFFICLSESCSPSLLSGFTCY